MSLPTSIPWLLYRTPLLVSYRKRVPNIDTNWVFKREQEKQVPRSQSWREKKSVFHGHTVGPWSRSHRWAVILFEKASTEHVDSDVFNVAELEYAKRFEPRAILKATRKDFHLAVLQVSFPKKKQEIHREGTVTEICDFLFCSCKCGCRLLRRCNEPICPQRLMLRSTWISWRVTAVMMPFQSAVNWSFLIPNYK